MNDYISLSDPRYPEIYLRIINETDISLLRTWKNNNKEYFFLKEDITSEQQEKWFQDYLSRNHDYMFVILYNGYYAGCIGFRLLLAEKCVDLYNLIIVPELQKKGIMSSSLKLIIKEIKKKYIVPIKTKVLKINSALEWYKKNDFIIESEHSNYYTLIYNQKKEKAPMISVFGSLVGDQEITNVIDCMKSQWMGFGKNVDEFEKKFSEKFKVPNFAMVDSGSNALYMAVSLLDLAKGSKIIVPSFTWVSCAQAVLIAGHIPVFCDVDLETMNVREQDIQKCRKDHPDTKAIMVVHYAGLPVDMDPILNLALPVIEDAAHAVASTYKGAHCGTIAEVGIYSFDAVKNLTTGEGGGIACKRKNWLDRAKIMRYCGIGKSGFEAATSNRTRWWEYNIQEPFIKMLPTNMAAGIGLAQLNRIDDLQKRRYEIWTFFQESFSKLGWIKIPQEAETYSTHSYFTYCIRVPKRDELASFLLDNGVYTTLRYHPLHLNPLYKQTNISLPNCEKLNEEGLSIPLHPRLSDNDVDKIIDLIKEFGYNNTL